MIIEQVTVGEMEVFCYVIGCEETREAAAIDPAGDKGDIDKIIALLEEKNLQLSYIINTHGHADHTYGNQLLASRTGAKTVMHEIDDDLFTTEEAKGWAAAFGLSAAPPVDIRISDGDRLPLGKLNVEFIHTPGHTPGAVCVLVENNLFTGDTLFVGAVGRTDLPGGSMETLLNSIEKKLLPLPGETVIWPGHNYGDQPTSTMAREMETNPYITDFILDT
ncbi:MAG: MBL fold metallo-hydrolase [Syntrophobacterales bacterium]|jgi:glyoxylase-like metal-dependent hydrolase (beta-lactamase superfamily II)